ncbi:MAG: DUF1326 domain-containing protein [Acidobacteriota bacterium]
MSYLLKGRLLEVCTCNTLCPCWVGDDPDNGTCDSALAYHFDSGNIDGEDVAGLTLALAVHIPGNVLKGNWRALVFIDDKATKAQEAALLSVYSGKAGGPVADLVKLIGEVIDVRRVPISFDVVKGKGTFVVGDAVHAELEPFLGPTGQPTTLTESIFSTVPGSPAYVGKASSYRQKSPELKQDISLKGHNAILSDFLFDHRAAA